MASAKPLILVVDDDAPIITLMRSLLREFGFEPLTAMNGEDAIASARERRPDLILVDKNMPGLSGAQVIQAIRAESEIASTPVLILSGEPMSEADLRAIGADGAILKPFDIRALLDHIRGYLR